MFFNSILLIYCLLEYYTTLADQSQVIKYIFSRTKKLHKLWLIYCLIRYNKFKVHKYIGKYKKSLKNMYDCIIQIQ